MRRKAKVVRVPTKVGKEGKKIMSSFAARQWILYALDELVSADKYQRSRNQIIAEAFIEYLEKYAPQLIKKHKPLEELPPKKKSKE